MQDPPPWQLPWLVPVVTLNPNLPPQALSFLLHPLRILLYPASLHLLTPTGSADFSQRFIIALVAQRTHGQCLRKVMRCFRLSRKFSMQCTQISSIEWNGVTRFAPRYYFPLFFLQPILFLPQFLGEQPFIFQKVYLWQPSDSGCRAVLQRWWIRQQTIPDCSLCTVGCKEQRTGPLASTNTRGLQAWTGVRWIYCMSIFAVFNILLTFTLRAHRVQLIFLNPTSLYRFFRPSSRGVKVPLSTMDIF